MEIRIDDEFQIATDSRNWMIQKKTLVKNEIYWESIAYFGSLRHAVKYLAEYQIRALELSDVNKIINAIDSIQFVLSKALKPYDIEVS